MRPMVAAVATEEPQIAPKPALAEAVLEAFPVKRTQCPEHLHALVSDHLGLIDRRRLHAHEGQDLEHVVLEHVAQDPCLLVIPCPLLDAYRLGSRYLDMVDEVPVPDGLEYRVGETEHHYVLDRVLAQVMVYPEYLLLPEVRPDRLLQRAGAFKVAAVGFFYDYPRPPLLFRGQTRGGNCLDYARVDRRRG